MESEGQVSASKLAREEDKATFIEAAEFRQIQLRRIKVLTGHEPEEAPNDCAPEAPQHERDLVGLAISGGGIRSATFGLGLLQGLAELNLLKHVDYLSTVSGGGYIGSWFSTWVKREGDLENVAKQLKPKRAAQAEAVRGFSESKTSPATTTRPKSEESEPEPIHHLRQYSNYFAPRLSLFSADTWGLLAIYIRNLVANLMAILPTMMFVFLLARLITLAFTAEGDQPIAANVFGVIVLLGLLSVFGLIAKTVKSLQEPEARDKKNSSLGIGWFFSIPFTLTVVAILMTWLFVPFPSPKPLVTDEASVVNAETNRAEAELKKDLEKIQKPGPALQQISRFAFWMDFSWKAGAVEWSQLAFMALIFGVSHALIAAVRGIRLWTVVAGAISGMAGGALCYLVLNKILWPQATEPGFIATFGPPLLLLVYAASAIVEVMLLSSLASEREREWWTSLMAWLIIVSFVWALVFSIALYAWLGISCLNGYLQAGLLTGWIGTIAIGVIAARSGDKNAENESIAVKLLNQVAPFVFLLGLLCFASGFTRFLLMIPNDYLATAEVEHALEQKFDPKLENELYQTTRSVKSSDSEKTEQTTDRRLTSTLVPNVWARKKLVEWNIISNPSGSQLLILLTTLGGLACLVSYRIDVNEFSLNAMYANRLTRCYLGATRQKATVAEAQQHGDEWAVGNATPAHCHGKQWYPNRVTGFDPDDDIKLHAFANDGSGKSFDLEASTALEDSSEIPFWGPYPLINTALNLVAGDELAWQERMAESFLLSPLYCGSNSLGYCPTKEYAGGLTLGKAVAISGAAASPNMGHHSSPALAAMMTLFNIRMGWWLPNPKEWDPQAPHPRWLLKWLAIELLSQTNSKRKFLNISDGGHFENLAAYELIRRRCRCVIVSDAGADPNYEFEDLAGLVRKCRTDFGIDIEINLDALRPDPITGKSDRHCAVGTIRYDHVEPTAPVGTLVVIKPSLTGNEQADIQHYTQSHPDFPQQPTLDQFFDESQFESYRLLGHSIAKQVFEEVARGIVAGDGNSASNRDDCKCDENVKPDFHNSQLESNRLQHEFVQNFVYRLQKKWLPPPAGVDEGFLEAVKPFVALHRDLRTEPSLANFTTDLYPEIESILKRTEDTDIRAGAGANANPGTVPRREEIHLALQMMQVMENAWLGVKLDEYHAHPLNAGWMNLFKRWGNTKLILRYWHVIRHEFSREFIQFCEREMSVKCPVQHFEFLADIEAKITNGNDASLTCAGRLFHEFEAEWPDETGDRNLRHLVSQAVSYNIEDDSKGSKVKKVKAAWGIRLLSQEENNSEITDEVVGIIAVLPLPFEKCPLPFQADRKRLGELRKEQNKAPCIADKTNIAKTIADLEQKTQEAYFEAIVYVRPAFRQHGIGQKLIEQLVCSEQGLASCLGDTQREKMRVNKLCLRKAMGINPRVVLLYPKTGWHGQGADLVKKRWLSYFSFYDFRRPALPAEWPHCDNYELLVSTNPEWQEGAESEISNRKFRIGIGIGS